MRKTFKVTASTVASFYLMSHLDTGSGYLKCQISNDAGNTWKTLDTYDGYIDPWSRKSYNYSSMNTAGISSGDQCILRFVANFEQASGWWAFPRYGYALDDISITNTEISGYTGWSTLANNITATSYGITGKSPGVHAYRVRSYSNSVWQDYGFEGETTVDLPPAVTINQAAAQTDPTNSSTINFTVIFSESVADFATGDVAIAGTAPGTKTGTVTGSGTTYNVAVTGMTGSGTVIASIAAGVAHDAATNGNTASTSTDSTVTYDTVAPVVTPPVDLTVEATSSDGAIVTFPAATATDAVGVTSLTYSQDSGTTFPIGATTVTVTAKDAADNTGTTTFIVTVADTTAPAVTPLVDLTVEATSSDGAIVTFPAATATDAVGVTSLTYSQDSGTTFPIGATTVTVTAKDAADNTGTTTFIVTVADTTAPAVTPLVDLTVEATSSDGAIVTFPAATATDAVGVTSLTYSQDSGTTFPIGATTVTVTAKDAADNTGTTTFIVTVADTTAPAVTPLVDLTVEATSSDGAIVTFPAATATDAVGVTSLTYSQDSGTTFPIGATTVTVTAKDAADNTGTTTFIVTVADTTAPAVTPLVDLTVEATSSDGAIVTFPAATATDAVGVTSLTYSQDSGTTFPIGATTVTVTAKDAADNTGTTTFIVTVADTTAPAVTPLVDLTVEATSSDGAIVTFPAATATDAVGVTSLTYSQDSGTTFPIGATTVTVTAKDAADNTGTTTFIVTVADTTAPAVTPLVDLTVEATSSDGAIVTFPAATATDAVGVTSLTYSQDSGTTFPIGATTVTVTAKDAADNTGTTTFIVTVTPLTPIQSWREQYFGTIGNSGDASDSADPNGNGIVNLLEYALGGDPFGNTTGMAILPRPDRNASNALQINFNRYTDRIELTLIVQAADSLAGPWTNLAQSTAGAPFVVLAPGATAHESGTGTMRSITVDDLHSADDPAHPMRFMRLEVSNVDAY